MKASYLPYPDKHGDSDKSYPKVGFRLADILFRLPGKITGHKKTAGKAVLKSLIYSLFCNNFKFNFSFVAVAEIYLCFVCTKFFNLVQDGDATTIDLVSFLFFDRACDLN